MKYLSFKHYFYIIMLVVILFPGKIFAQSKSVFFEYGVRTDELSRSTPSNK